MNDAMQLTDLQKADLRWLSAHSGATLMQFCRSMNVNPRQAAARIMALVIRGLVEIISGQDNSYRVTERGEFFGG